MGLSPLVKTMEDVLGNEKAGGGNLPLLEIPASIDNGIAMEESYVHYKSGGWICEIELPPFSRQR